MTEVALREQVQIDAKVIDEIMWQGSRITQMLNQAQDWLQGKLIKQGYMTWSNEEVVTLVTAATLLGVGTGRIIIPTDVLRDMPMENVMPYGGAKSVEKPAQEIALKNFVWTVNNPVAQPHFAFPIFVVVKGFIHIYPIQDNDTVRFSATLKVLDLVFDNDAQHSEIPTELQWVLVERVVMQIKSIEGQEQIKQAKVAEIDKELTFKYQLDALKKEDTENRSQPQ
jgi:hypothetical protein